MALGTSKNRAVALALDFDGVICDSIHECLVTSYHAFRAQERSAALPSDIPASLRRHFYARRGFVRPSGHYYLLWKWITEFPDRLLSPQMFESLEASYGDAVARFGRAFHEARDVSREKAAAEWLALNPLYPGVVEAWPALLAWPRYIVTTKDRPSVETILSAHGLGVSGIFARGDMTKPDALRSIALRERVPPENVLFVDDNALHLLDARAVGVVTCLARWGYGPREGHVGPALERFAELSGFLAAF